MNKLSLSQWTSIAEIMGMVAVVISLIFVGLEIRQNTDLVETASIESGFDFRETVYHLGGDEETDEKILRGLEDFINLSQVEKVAFDRYFTKTIVTFNAARQLYLRGLLEEELNVENEVLMAQLLLSPGITTLYRMHEDTVPLQVRDHFNQMMIDFKDVEPLSEYFKYETGFK